MNFALSALTRQVTLRARSGRASARAVFVWLPVPDGHNSASFATFLLEEAGVVVPPGRGYGVSGEGFVRISLTVPDDRLEEGLERIRTALAR